MWVRVTQSCVVALSIALGGCAANRHLHGSSPGAGVPRNLFWPPPPGTALSVRERANAAEGASLATAAGVLTEELGAAGYSELRWFPIGLGFARGFAVATRMERLDDDGAPVPTRRWTSRHSAAPTLQWLVANRTPTLPEPGRYRTLLLAVTDLPIGPSPYAPLADESTIMAGPDIPEDLAATDPPDARPLTASHQLGVFTYVYESDDADEPGQLVWRHPESTESVVGADAFRGAARELFVLPDGG